MKRILLFIAATLLLPLCACGAPAGKKAGTPSETGIAPPGNSKAYISPWGQRYHQNLPLPFHRQL